MAKPLKINYELKNRSEEETLLSVTFTWQGKRNKVSLGVKVLSSDWDPETNRVLITSKQTQAIQRRMKKINRFIDAFEKEVATLHLDWINEGFEYHHNLSKMAELLRSKIAILQGREAREEKKRSFLPIEYFQKVIDEMPQKIVKRTGKFIDEKTVEHHKIVFKRFVRFMEFNKWQNKGFEIFDKTFETIMENWMLGVELYTPNTVCATFSVMKVWLNQAEEDGLIKEKHFHSWKSKGFDVQHVYLTDAELRAIYNIQFTDEFKQRNKIDPTSSIEQTRDIFMIASQIGLRYGDMGSLNSANWDIDNRCVEVHTHKTGETVKVPLSSMVVELYEKYDGKFPQPIDKGKFNRQLTKICELAGIIQEVFIKTNAGGKIKIEGKRKCDMVSSHTARRSFATNLYLRSKNARMVMAFTGHKTEENFRKYICVEKDEMVDLARQYFQ